MKKGNILILVFLIILSINLLYRYFLNKEQKIREDYMKDRQIEKALDIFENLNKKKDQSK